MKTADTPSRFRSPRWESSLLVSLTERGRLWVRRRRQHRCLEINCPGDRNSLPLTSRKRLDEKIGESMPAMRTLFKRTSITTAFIARVFKMPKPKVSSGRRKSFA